MKISFIVLTYNRSDALLAVMRGLAAQCGAQNEVLIADDGSTPDQIAHLARELPAFNCPVLHVWHPDTGFTAARARNRAANVATGDYLVFLDGDCVPKKSFVAQHKRLAEQHCFVNGSRVLLSKNLSEQVCSGAIDLGQSTFSFWLKMRLRGDCNKLLHLLVWPWRLFRVKQGFEWRGIRSCNMAVWRSDFIAVNGFDEVFEGWGHEDADFALRLSHLGVQRKNGFMATEVFHLWHGDNQRAQEALNKSRVTQRFNTHLIKAEKGLAELGSAAQVKITHLH